MKKWLPVIIGVPLAGVVFTAAVVVYGSHFSRSARIERAEQELLRQVETWTEWERKETRLALKVNPVTDLYLTYINVQLAEAAVAYRATAEGLSQNERQQMLDEVHRRLALGGSVPMILYVRGNRDDWCLRLNGVEQSLVLTSVAGERTVPSRYDRFLDEPRIYLNHDREAYVFFPSDILDASSEPSFTVIGAVSAYWCASPDRSWQVSSEIYVLHWRFDLVPIEIPVSKEADKHPQPSGVIPAEVLMKIMSMVVDLVALIAK